MADNRINLLITGGCGFIGSNFINYYFSKINGKIINLDALYYCADINNIEMSIQKSNQYIFIKGNLCDSDLVKSILHKHNITHIIHFAAQSHVQNSFDDSLQFTKDNILGTHILLENCRKYGKIIKFIHCSTDEVYGESMNTIDELRKTEHSILCPTNPYASTKAAAELIAQSYNHSYNIPIIITRGNNVYGPNQYPEKLIPRFIKLLNEDKKLTIQGDGSSVRAFLHVDDTTRAFECILNNGKIGEIYNIGCDENMEYSVMKIAEILIKMIKNTENYNEWIEYVEDRAFNDQRYYISNQKLKSLGWDIKINLTSGLYSLLNRFDYKLYLSIYPDLKLDKIITEEKAYQHYLKFGKKEGRCCSKIAIQTHLNNSNIKILEEKNKFKINKKYEDKINILIRTSNRPEYFKECIQSVLTQDYNNYNVIICYDKKDSLIYLEKYNHYNNIQYFFIENTSEEKYKFNLYCNILMDKVDDGWIIFLDDDDSFTHNKVLKIINDNINSEKNLYFWKFLRMDKLIFPRNMDNIKIGDIDTTSVCFHNKYKNLSRWNDKQYGDYLFFNDLIPNSKCERVFVDYILTQTIDKTKISHFGN